MSDPAVFREWVTREAFRPDQHLDPKITQTKKHLDPKALRPEKCLDPKALRPKSTQTQKHLDQKSTQIRKALRPKKALRPEVVRPNNQNLNFDCFGQIKLSYEVWRHLGVHPTNGSNKKLSDLLLSEKLESYRAILSPHPTYAYSY